MEQKHLDQIQKITGSKHYSKITVIHIPDIYKYYDKELIHILKQKVTF